jgi:hypothetical protein
VEEGAGGEGVHWLCISPGWREGVSSTFQQAYAILERRGVLRQ